MSSCIDKSQKILDVLIIFLTHLRCVHLLDCSPLTREEVLADLLNKKDTLEIMLAQDDMLEMEVFAFSDVIYRVDRIPLWDEVAKRKYRKGRFVGMDEVREWAGIWRAEKVD